MSTDTVRTLLNLNTTAPSVEQVEAWLTDDLGLSSSIVGHSYHGHPLKIFEWWGNGNPNGNPNDDEEKQFQTTTTTTTTSLRGTATSNKNNKKTPSLLLLSMVHGNEPMGLMALLDAVQKIVRFGSNSTATTNNNLHLIVFPIVNVDGYKRNLVAGHGLHRGNANGDRGVDLNRNHPRDWVRQGKHHGMVPWSEPESQTIQRVVIEHRPTAAISFHSRAYMGRPPLLIHPYTSTRNASSMPPENMRQYEKYGTTLNQDQFYIVGNAQDAIHYTAGGSTIDWMHSFGTLSVVIEVTPPCGDRWCDKVTLVHAIIGRYSKTATDMAQMLADGQGGLPVVEAPLCNNNTWCDNITMLPESNASQQYNEMTPTYISQVLDESEFDLPLVEAHPFWLMVSFLFVVIICGCRQCRIVKGRGKVRRQTPL